LEIVVTVDEFNFEWDSAKAEPNLKKHGVDFFDAVDVFLDPLARTLASGNDEEEERQAVVGVSRSLNLLLVVHTERDDYIRLISARTATRQERRLYEEQ
jgi:uncharacterized DUF497 family protein